MPWSSQRYPGTVGEARLEQKGRRARELWSTVTQVQQKEKKLGGARLVSQMSRLQWNDVVGQQASVAVLKEVPLLMLAGIPEVVQPRQGYFEVKPQDIEQGGVSQKSEKRHAAT